MKCHFIFVGSIFVSKNIQSLKIQASERFMLLTERINPISLLHRISPIGKNAQEYRLELITEIQSEYNHYILRII